MTTVQTPATRRDCGTGLSLQLRSLGRVFEGGIRAIDHIDLDIAGGDFVAILGPSGCGKSTLLRLVAGLDKPSAGTLKLERCDTCPREGCGGTDAIAYVFQDAHLLPWRNVLRNVALPLELRGWPLSSRLEIARQSLEQVGLGDALMRYPAQLSGGMKMRASLARALVTQPKLLLLDEPFAALDELTRQRLDEQLRDLWRCQGMTVLFVTHSTSEAAFLANRAVVLSPRPARIIADRTLALPLERRASLRATHGFAAEMAALYEALARGGEGL